MKRCVLLVFLFILPAFAYAQPSIKFDEETHDFGTVPRGDAIEHDFVFTNSGDQELIIEKLIPS